jgi:hypothetical protein
MARRGGRVIAAVGAQTKAFWYLTRGTGVVSLVLLTGVVVLGLTGSMQWASPRWPRFITQGLHRNLSLLSVGFIGAHVATTVIDGFAPIRWLDAVVPLASAYRPLWLGLGALAFDLVLALVVTSMLRVHLGYRSWRAVHWLAYACWPVAVLHGLGTGSDTAAVWMLGVNAVCVGAVLAAVVWRAGREPSRRPAARGFALGAAGVVSLGLVGWLAVGPLAVGWAREAGTPPRLLAAGVPDTGTSGSAPVELPATSTFDGTATEQQVSAGEVDLEFRGTLSGPSQLVLDIRIQGQVAQAGGGLVVQGGRVALGPPGDQARYQGQIGGVTNGQIDADLTDAAGASVTMAATLRIADASGAATGEVRLTGPGG